MTVPLVRKRAKRPKTRTGCRTCRARHVKCDEAKPSCQRCRTAGRPCAGYEPGVTSLQVQAKPRPVLLPLATGRDQVQYLDWGLAMAPISLASQELQAFDFFRIHTVTQLPEGPWDACWGQMALQIAYQEPAIVHAMVALGAIHQYFTDAFETRTTLSVNIGTDQHRFAIRHYNKAMSYIRNCVEMMTSGRSNCSVEVILISCLLFLSFEMLESSDPGALTHLRLGLRILYEYMKPRTISLQPNGKRTIRINAFPENHLEKLLHTFVRLDYDLTQYGDIEPYLLPECSTELPSTFIHLDEARVHLDILSSALLHAKGVFLRAAENALNADPNVCGLDEDARYSMMHWISQTVPMDSDPNAIAELNKAQDGLNRWLDAMASFPIPTRKEDLQTHLTLQIEFFHIWLTASTARDSTETLCDRFRDSFTYILGLTEQYIQLTYDFSTGSDGLCQARTRRNHNFNLRASILTCLHAIAVKCRKSSIRWKAQELINKTNIIGIGDSSVLAAFTKRLIQLEEDRARRFGGYPPDFNNFDYHQVPEQARLLDVTLCCVEDSVDTGRLVCSVWSDSSCKTVRALDDHFNIPETAGWMRTSVVLIE